MRNVTKILIGAGFLLSGGCYRYVPAEMTTVPRGTEVRAVLNGDGADALRGTFGPDVTSVDGPLVFWDREGMGLLAELYVTRAGFPRTTMTDTIRLLPHHLARVEAREFDAKRSLGFSAVVVGGIVGAVIATRAFGGSSEDPVEGGGIDPDASILIRIPFSIGGG